MLSCTKCGYGFNFLKANQLLDEFEKVNTTSNFIERALQDDNKIIGNFTLNQLTKDKEFSNLNNDKKTSILRLYKDTKEDLENKGLLICSFCKFIKFIDDGQVLLEDTFISSIRNDEVFNTHFRTEDKTLPRTREYNCPNKNCKSYKNKKLKEAVIYRKRDTMEVSYMCCVCNEYWKIC